MKHDSQYWQKKALLILAVEVLLIFTHSIFATT